MFRLFRSLLAVFALLFLPAALSAQKGKPVVNAALLFDKTPAAVGRLLGEPVRVSSNRLGAFHDYPTKRGRLAVRFDNGKARSFSLYLERAEADPGRAAALLGISLKGAKPAQNTRLRKSWRGKFAHPLIKEVGVSNRGAGWNLVVVTDSF